MQLFPGCNAFLWSSMTANNCNTFLIQGEQKVLIDPGHLNHFGHVEDGLKELGLTIEDIDVVICTLCHPDNLEATKKFKNTKALMAFHEKEWPLVTARSKQFEATLGISLDDITPDFYLKEGAIELADIKLQAYHTPGHSPGSVCFYWPEKKALFTGDLIFNNGLGRTDLSGGNGTELKQSIKRMGELDLDWILPGHGDIISGSTAIQQNFLQLEHVWFQYI
jgi:hydroxyacylglutathione hydrolase